MCAAGIDVLVFAMESSLQTQAISAARALRESGRTVDLQLEVRQGLEGTLSTPLGALISAPNISHALPH